MGMCRSGIGRLGWEELRLGGSNLWLEKMGDEVCGERLRAFRFSRASGAARGWVWKEVALLEWTFICGGGKKGNTLTAFPSFPAV